VDILLVAKYAGLLDPDEHFQGKDEGPDVRRYFVVWICGIVYVAFV
jgi:hypothetical protein